MIVKNPKYRKRISKSQLRLLLALFKFRFVTVPLLSEYGSKDKSTIYERLLTLVDQGYIRKDYDSSYRLPPRPAIYSLAAPGIKTLRHAPIFELSEAALRNMYKNKTASEPLVVHSLDVFKLWLQLNKQYPDTFDIFTKSEMTDFTDFIRPLPDLYLQRKNTRSTKSNYFLEMIEAGTVTWILRKRIQAHQAWLDEHEEEWGKDYPTLLFVCGNNNTEKRLHRLVNNGYFEFEVMTTTNERLASSEMKIWVHEWWEDEEIQFKGL